MSIGSSHCQPNEEVSGVVSGGCETTCRRKRRVYFLSGEGHLESSHP